MKRKTGSFQFVAATIILVTVAAISFAGTAMAAASMAEMPLGRMNFGGAEPEGYYREREQRLVRETRQELERQGFLNSGVTLTRVVEEDGKRIYTVTVHHRDIDRMEAAEREALARELAVLAFEDENSSFRYEFLITAQL